MIRRQICLLFKHKFAGWDYIVENSCEQQRICQRDGYTEKRIAPHQWGDFEYISPTNCHQLRTCKRCGQEDNIGEVHEWKQVMPEVTDREVCSRCRLIKIDRGECSACEGKGEVYKIRLPTTDPSFYYETSVPYSQLTSYERDNPQEYMTFSCSSCGGSGRSISFHKPYKSSQQ